MINYHSLTKSLLIVSLIWIIIDGVFRKWLMPSLSTPLFVLKYVFFILTYLSFLFQTNFRLPKINKTYQQFIILFVIWCLLNFLNPTFKTSWLVKIFGFINYIFFIPLTIIIPYYFSSLSFFEKTIRFLAYLSIPIFILGIIQYYLPVDHILNYLPNEDQKFTKVAEYTRSNSIFSFVKIYNVYLLFTLTLFFSYLFYSYNKNKTPILYVFLILIGILNQFMTGSRLPISLTGIYFLFISIYIFLNVTKLRKTIVLITITGVLTLFFTFNLSETFNTAISSFFKRAEFVEQVASKGVEGYSAEDRVIDRLDIFKFSNEAGYFGFGIGTTYQGTGMILSEFRPDIPFEEEGERVVLEIGIIGGIILLLLRLFILLYLLNYFFKTNVINLALLKIPFILLIIPPIFFLNNTTFNYFDGFSYWLAFGLVLALNKINQQHQSVSE